MKRDVETKDKPFFVLNIIQIYCNCACFRIFIGLFEDTILSHLDHIFDEFCILLLLYAKSNRSSGTQGWSKIRLNLEILYRKSVTTQSDMSENSRNRPRKHALL